MALNGYVDDQLDMMCEGLFDNIDDLLDFSTDDEVLEMVASAGGGGGGGGGGDDGLEMPPAPIAETFHALKGEGSRVTAISEENKICDEINVSEDWITNFLDESNFDIDESLSRSFSPISVLDEPINPNNQKGSSSSSSSSFSSTSSNNETAYTVSLCPLGPTVMPVPARARSKRPRRAALAHVTVPILPPASDGPPAVPTLLPECDITTGDSCCPLIMKKKKKKSLTVEDGIVARRCMHCGIQKTPQWRAGPMGPKSLCNACGVRYKSGRLFPEYRPAASPTFVPSLHSNSHKKVVEMRIKACEQKAANGAPLPEYPAAKNCDLLAYIRRKE